MSALDFFLPAVHLFQARAQQLARHRQAHGTLSATAVCLAACSSTGTCVFTVVSFILLISPQDDVIDACAQRQAAIDAFAASCITLQRCVAGGFE
jgi:hypothetical protein